MRKYILVSLLLVLSAVVSLASSGASTHRIDVAFYRVNSAVQCRVVVTDEASKEVVFAPALNFDPAQSASATTTRKDDPGAEWKVDASVTKDGRGVATITFSRDGKILKTYRGKTTISETAPE